MTEKNFDKKIMLKRLTKPISRGLNRFSNNILVKSLVSGFVSVMPIVLVSSLFVLMYALPEAFSNALANGENSGFNSFKSFAVRVYQFTYGILGLLVTGNIARAMMEELNLKLPFDKRVKTFNVLIIGIIIYLIMSAIPFLSPNKDNQNGHFDPVNDSWFDGIFWSQLGAQGILPGIIVGLTTPYVFYWCYKYNITIRMPKQVPGVISQSFLTIIPMLFALVFWSGIAYLFIYYLKEPFIPWLFGQMGSFIPQLTSPVDIPDLGIVKDQVLTTNNIQELTKNEIYKPVLNQIIDKARNSFSNSWGIIFLYRFLETFSWFIGVHPEAIQGIFESIAAVNQGINIAIGNSGETLFFVESTINVGAMGGTGATFILPILCLLFGKSTQLKVAGKTSVVPVMFQVNEPILFGLPCILNPFMFVPFIFVPTINTCFAKLFVDNLGMQASSVNIPWATPWFIRGAIAQNFQPLWFFLGAISLACSIILYLPFVILQDKAFLKAEVKENGAENVICLNYPQLLFMKSTLTDFYSRKILKKQIHHIGNENNKNYKEYYFAKQKYINKSKENLTYLFDKEAKIKIDKYQMRINDINEKIDSKINQKKQKIKNYNAAILAKIDEKKEFYKQINLDDSATVAKLESKLKKLPKPFILHKNEVYLLENKIEIINQELLLKKLIVNKKFNLIERIFENYKGLNDLKLSKKIILNSFEVKNQKKKINALKKIHSGIFNDQEFISKLENENININASYGKLENKINELKVQKNNIKSSEINNKKENKVNLYKINQDIKQEKYNLLINSLIIKSIARFKKAKNNLAYQTYLINIKLINLINPFAKQDSQSQTQVIFNQDNKEKTKKEINVLVLCIGAGTSAMLANAINNGSKKIDSEPKINANALAYDSYKDALKDVDLIITSPQLRAYLSSIKKDAESFNIKVIPTKGKQYIDLCNNPDQAVELVINSFKDEKEGE